MARTAIFRFTSRDAVARTGIAGRASTTAKLSTSRPSTARACAPCATVSPSCHSVCRIESQFLAKRSFPSLGSGSAFDAPSWSSVSSACRRCVKVSARLAPPERPAATPSEERTARPPDGDAWERLEKANGAAVREEKREARETREKARHVSMVVKVCGEDQEPQITCAKVHDHPTLVLMRHGESMWNDLKLFTGDVDIPLTERGVMEAMAGGRSVAEIDFDMIFTSRLVRSKQTALLAMTQSVHKAVPVIVRGGYYGRGKTGDENRLRLREAAAQALKQAACRMIPVYADPRLNERCYGDLQGLNKEAAAKEFGHEQVAMWRRSHDTSPPKGESLLDTSERTLAFFLSTVEPRLAEGKNVLVVAHGNVLRCIISYLCDLSELEMLRLHIGTAHPYCFAFNGEEYAQCCALPPVDPYTQRPRQNVPIGLVSALKSARTEEVDSLI
ncbi:hypothetical protein CLOM_g14022 [Closterium sp. NIES-68]|nr:hypothetical protein CLOM_g14022 [Closterium sp. NIES-68]